jgi:hypothetical protein
LLDKVEDVSEVYHNVNLDWYYWNILYNIVSWCWGNLRLLSQIGLLRYK